MEAGCMECECVLQKYKGHYAPYFAVHITGIWSSDKASKERRSQTRESLQKIVCALQNTEGGDILIHHQDQQNGDRYLGFFDEFICKLFPNVTEDGEMSTEIYSREWLCEIPGFKAFQTFIKLSVRAVSLVSTVEFNTKIRNDVENTEPSVRCLLRYLSKEVFEERDLRPRGIENLDYLHENRNIELKMLRIESSLHTESLLSNPSSLADYIWYKLKLRDNLTSMAKVRGGGSFFVGISEKENRKGGKCPTKHLKIDGFVTSDNSLLLEKLSELAESHLLVLNPDGTFNDPPDDLYKLHLHPTQCSKYVLEVRVRQMNGILFYDKSGPRAFRIQTDGQIKRMDKAEWIMRIQKWAKETSLR